MDKTGIDVYKRQRQISVFELVNSESDIYSQIVNQAKECDMTTVSYTHLHTNINFIR